MRTADECYRLFKKHQAAADASATFTEFYKSAGLNHLEPYAGGWVEKVFRGFKAGKETYKPLEFPTANKFSDLFTSATLIPIDMKQKPAGVVFLGGNAGYAKHLGGRRGWSERTPDTRCHYGAKFYGTYVTPCDAVVAVFGKYEYSFEAIRRTDGILITAQPRDYIGSTWLALLDLSEDITTVLDETTQNLIKQEQQAEIDAWGEVRL